MTKALGKDVWDFYLNGFPQEYSHDTWTIQIAYWPDENSARGAYSLLEDDKEYDLKDFGTLWDMTSDKSLTFEEAYLKWKGVEKSEPDVFDLSINVPESQSLRMKSVEKSISFDQWFDIMYPNYIKYAESESGLKRDLRLAWDAAIASTKEQGNA